MAKILIVDDEPDMLKLLNMILREKTSYEIITTNNPIEARELVKQGGFDLVLSDLKMPGLDGIEIIDADIVFLAVGVTTNLEGIGLEKAGVKTEKGKVAGFGTSFTASVVGSSGACMTKLVPRPSILTAYVPSWVLESLKLMSVLSFPASVIS